jgi:hypothetical protein
MNSLYAFPSGSAEVPVVTLSASPESQDGVGTVTLTAAVTGAYDSLAFTLERTDKNGASQSAPALSGSGLTRTFTPAARGDTYLATVEADFNGGANSVFASCVAGTTVLPDLEWQTVADFDFSLEADQSGATLTVTNRVDSSSVVFDAANGAVISGGALVLTTAAGGNISGSTDTAPRLDAALTTIYPGFDRESLCWAALVSAAPTYTESGEAWGVMASGPVRMGGGSMGYAVTAEVQHTGSAVQRRGGWQSTGSASQPALSTATYASGRVCALQMDGAFTFVAFDTDAAKITTPETISALGPAGAAGAASGGSPIGGSQTTSRLGVFARSGAGAGPNISISRLILRALRPVR